MQTDIAKKELLERVARALAGSSAHTISQFQAVASRFYSFSNGELSRGTIVKYIQSLDKQGYAPGTRALHFRILKRVFEINGVPWEFGKRPPSELPIEIPSWEVERPVIPFDEIEMMINGAKNGKVPPAWAGILAASTVYGLRRIEMIELSPELVDLDAGWLRVITAKHGKSREHVIPDEIKPYLRNYPYGQYSESGLSQIFHAIRAGAGLSRVYGGGWHSIRRCLDTYLVDHFGVPIARDYLRWKKSTFEMAIVYWTPPPPEVIDKKVQEELPTVRMWG